MVENYIDKYSLNNTKIEMQKTIIKLLYERDEITLNQYNLIISKLDKKTQNFKKGQVESLSPITLDIKM